MTMTPEQRRQVHELLARQRREERERRKVLYHRFEGGWFYRESCLFGSIWGQ